VGVGVGGGGVGGGLVGGGGGGVIYVTYSSASTGITSTARATSLDLHKQACSR